MLEAFQAGILFAFVSTSISAMANPWKSHGLSRVGGRSVLKVILSLAEKISERLIDMSGYSDIFEYGDETWPQTN
jgi:hypothetical protein